MRLKQNLLGFLLGIVLLPAFSPAAPGHLQFQVDLAIPASQIEAYSNWLETPGIMAIALENSGVKLSYAGKLQIPGRQEIKLVRQSPFPFKEANLAFQSREGSLFHYQAGITWTIAGAAKSFSLPLTISLAELNSGHVIVQLFPPLANVFPGDIVKRINQFIARAASAPMQNRFLNYLISLGPTPRSADELNQLGERVLFDAYNHSTAGAGLVPQPGDDEPLSEQILLIVTLAFWIILLPALLVTRAVMRWWRRPARPVAPQLAK